jgi:hypothetical protein
MMSRYRPADTVCSATGSSALSIERRWPAGDREQRSALRGGESPAQSDDAAEFTESLGQKLEKKIGAKKATMAVARKLSVILHRMWTTGQPFQWHAGTADA